jgi:hypothetical protein
MLRLTRRAFLLIAFSMLVSAAAAGAECAWVLWNDEARLDYGTHIESRVWHTIAGAPTRKKCEARLRREIERVTHPDNPPKDVLFEVRGDAVQLLYFRSDQPKETIARVQTFRYVCLPDTVDPRGPKGK